MIHDAATQAASSVPEELYNLTQLADVTLAAGKLSTTNIQTIKEYIKNEDILPANATETMQMTELIVMKRSQLLSGDASDSSSEMNSPQKLLSDAGYISDADYLDKKTFLYALNSAHSQSMDTDSSITMDICNSGTAPSIKSFAEHQRQCSFSSSEDDSTYNYSHKIFDKRKSRKVHNHMQPTAAVQQQSSKSLNAFNVSRNAMSIETEDSMLSISEAESNDADDGRGKINKINSNADILSKRKSNGELTASEAESMNGITCTPEDVHTCPECGKKYSTSSNLARHRQTHRSLLDKKARRCPHCDKGKMKNCTNSLCFDAKLNSI